MAGIDLTQLNKGQYEVATRLSGPLFVAAGAGSGKTFTLTARLIHALSPGSAPDGGRFLDSVNDALVITFTDAAALEIKERVRLGLREAGEHDPHLREEALKVDSAWISTIHGMCSRILRRHAIELGIDPQFEVCVGSVADALLARALDEVMQVVQHDDAYAKLREEFPVWSGGTGATSVAGIVRSLMDEANKCIDGFAGFRWQTSNETPSAVRRVLRAFEALAGLTLSETQRAAVDASLEALVPYCALAPGAQTAEAACAVLEQVKVPDIRKKDIKPLKDDARAAREEALVHAHYERVQDLLPQLIDLAARVDKRYGQLKHEHSYLDNDDLISCALTVVRDHPEVLRNFAGRFKLVMIDEFQDTDQKQLALISLLAGGKDGNLATVGDAQQSIYRFRGGDVEVFIARGKDLPKDCHVAMDVNYRSDHNVLALVERVCGDGGVLGDFLKLAADANHHNSFMAHEQDGSEAPRIRLEVVSGGNAELMSATLAAQLADRLATYRDQGERPGSMALLLGTTSKVGLYLDALRARGLPAVVTGGSSFSSTPEVGVIQALLHTLSNPHDTQTGLFRLLSSDMFRLDADDFCQLATRRQEVLEAPTKRPVEQCFIDGELELYGSAEPSPRLRMAHAVLHRAFERMDRWSVADVCQAVVEESGWLQRLEQGGVDGIASAANVLASVRYVRELTSTLGLGVARAADEFDQWLAAAKLTPAMLVGDTVDAVQVMTVHGSKGLQFAVTAVAECWSSPSSKGRLSFGREDGRCLVCLSPRPGVSKFSDMCARLEVPDDPEHCSTVAELAALLDQREAIAQANEKARLLYVALTRAEEALVVGIPVSDQKAHISDLAMGMLGAFPELDTLVPGECSFEVTPENPIECERREVDAEGTPQIVREKVAAAPGVARVVELVRPKRGSGDPWEVHSGQTLAGFDGTLPESVTLIPLMGVVGAAQDTSSTDAPFALYDNVVPTPELSAWRAREGVFSYSSAHALMQERTAQVYRQQQADAAVDTLPDTGREHPTPRPAKRPPTPPRAEQEAEAEGSAYTDDADKATNLGSAFHELAQTMIEAKADHDPARLEALARTWNLSARQSKRLSEAVARWEGCELRREALAYPLVRAEVPFFVPVESVYGSYVEGAIDLLACDPATGEALVVDYKTGDVGLSAAQIEERHRMQANFYAWVLMQQGFRRVSCAFACVEVDDGSGGPHVVRYSFSEQNRPVIA